MLAKEFQAMLRRFGLADKVLACSNDNAASNDTQTVALAKLPNSFEEKNRVRCFNHTLQLSVKTLLKPFNATLMDYGAEYLDMPEISDGEEDDDEENEDETEEGDDNDGEEVDSEGKDDADDGIDELDMLSSAERMAFLDETSGVRDTITKVSVIFH